YFPHLMQNVHVCLMSKEAHYELQVQQEQIEIMLCFSLPLDVYVITHYLNFIEFEQLDIKHNPDISHLQNLKCIAYYIGCFIKSHIKNVFFLLPG
ncbi:hypothetical protein ACJX0J_027098, partial [Zea mays]